jgi:hypothetical protein
MFRTFVVVLSILFSASREFLLANDVANQITPGIIRLDIFVRGDRESSKAVSKYAEELGQRVPGLDVWVHDVLQDQNQLTNLNEIAKKAGRDKPVLPAFHCCDRTYFGFVDQVTSGPEIERLFSADVYTRATCLRCQSFKSFLPSLEKRWPAIRFVILDVDKDPNARARWEALCRGSGVPPGLPTIDFARRVMIGYQGDEVTGVQLETLIKQVSGSEPKKPSPGDRAQGRSHISPRLRLVSMNFQTDQAGSQIPREPISGKSIELPDEADTSEIGEASAKSTMLRDEKNEDSIQLPFFGRIRVQDLGLPMFTFAVGIVDGFNPCAMWILVFLLSVLVNLKDRKKILLIAGTFVVVSGLAYFAFMAAWLNLFLLVGIVRPVQIALGLLALFIGVVNVKDFFAFKKGISLSISEDQKPGLYRRVRDIVSAKYLTVALSGAVALAVIVNMIELLCTAGLPALYTQILTLQELPVWKNYLYLGVYISAYMIDDAMLLTIVVATLSHRKLQEREGRWLKLLSGLVILILGLVMLFRPQWLELGGT